MQKSTEEGRERREEVEEEEEEGQTEEEEDERLSEKGGESSLVSGEGGPCSSKDGGTQEKVVKDGLTAVGTREACGSVECGVDGRGEKKAEQKNEVQHGEEEEEGGRSEKVPQGGGCARERESTGDGNEKDKKKRGGEEDARWEALLDRVLPKTWREEEKNSTDPFVRLVVDRLLDASLHFRKTLQWQDALADKWLKKHGTIEEGEETGEEEEEGEERDPEEVSSQEAEDKEREDVPDEEKGKCDVSHPLTHSKRDMDGCERCCVSSRS